MSDYITYRQFESAVSRIVNANLKAHKRSLSNASMRAGNLLLEIQEDRKIMVMRDGWRTEMKRRYLLITPTITAADIDYDWRADHNVYPHDTTVY